MAFRLNTLNVVLHFDLHSPTLRLKRRLNRYRRPSIRSARSQENCREREGFAGSMFTAARRGALPSQASRARCAARGGLPGRVIT